MEHAHCLLAGFFVAIGAYFVGAIVEIHRANDRIAKRNAELKAWFEKERKL